MTGRNVRHSYPHQFNLRECEVEKEKERNWKGCQGMRMTGGYNFYSAKADIENDSLLEMQSKS